MSTQRVGSLVSITKPELQEHLKKNETKIKHIKTSHTGYNDSRMVTQF